MFLALLCQHFVLGISPNHLLGLLIYLVAEAKIISKSFSSVATQSTRMLLYLRHKWGWNVGRGEVEWIRGGRRIL